MPALLDAADAFVSASAWEGMPFAVGEAMAMEKPVVATDVGGVYELVGDAGLVIPSQNSNALAEAMIATMQRSEDERAVNWDVRRDEGSSSISVSKRAPMHGVSYTGGCFHSVSSSSSPRKQARKKGRSIKLRPAAVVPNRRFTISPQSAQQVRISSRSL